MTRFYVRYVFHVVTAFDHIECDLTSERKQCLSREMGVLNEDSKHIVQGSYSDTRQRELCAVLFIHNIAQPEWLPLNCGPEILSHVICQFKQDIGSVTETWPSSKSCSIFLILIEGSCYHFVFQNSHQKPKCLGPVLLSTLIQAKLLFSIIFQSTGMTNVRFILRNNQVFLLYMDWMNIKTNLETGNEGFVVCTSMLKEVNFNGMYFLFMDNNTMISSVFCNKTETTNCLAESAGGKHLNSTDNCSELYYTSITGHCKSFKCESETEFFFQLAMAKKWAKHSVPAWHKFNIGYNFSKDGFSCKNIGVMHCKEADGKCFCVADICIYKLDANNDLIPCRSGFHMEACAHFLCHMHFKCPYFYCIPWVYVCDGAWDCPYGHDESLELTCGRSRICKNMFKCFRSQKCIHVQEICDKNYDCPYFDDECLCDVQKEHCVLGCQCLFYAISCNNVSFTGYLSMSLPFISYHILNSELNVTSFSLHQDTLRVNFSYNNFSGVPAALHNLGVLSSLDLSHNSLSQLESRPFKQMHHLHMIFVKCNQISHIGSNAFRKNNHLFLLNVEDNIITDMGENVFNPVSSLPLLLISNNTLPKNVISKFQLAQVSVKSLVTDSTALCCFAAHVYTCVQKSAWYFHCGRLLKSLDTAIIFGIVLVTVLNVSLLFTNLQSDYSERKKFSPYTMILNTLSVSYLLTSCCFILQVSYDSKYGNDYVYFVKKWKTSFNCKFSVHTILMCNLLTLCTHIFLAVSRMIVVIHPVETKFKKPKFVSCSLAAIFLACLVIALGASSALTYTSVPGVLCSPYDDPTKSVLVVYIVVVFTLIFQVCSLFLISGCFMLLIGGLKKSQKATDTTNRTKNTSIISQLVALVALHFCAWIPPSNTFLVCLFLSSYHLDIPTWALLVGLAVDAIGDPILFLSVSLKAYLKKKKMHPK